MWLENAKVANGLARQLSDGLAQFGRICIPNPVQANEVFVVMPRTLNDKLLASGAKFYDWMPDSLGKGNRKERFARFVFSYATPPSSVSRLLALVKELQPH